MLFLMEKNEEMLVVINKAIDSEHLTLKDKASAFLLRSQLHARLENLKEFKIDENESKTILRNLPDYEFVREMLKNYYTSTGYCKSKEDFHFIGEDRSVCIIYKTNLDCGCGCGGDKKKLSRKTLGLNRLDLFDDIKSEMGGMTFEDSRSSSENCSDNCDTSAAGAIAWATWNIRDGRIAAAFSVSVEILRRGCRKCCSEGNFYKTCIAPLLDKNGILANFGRGVDPAND